ncbi:hypothetical protein CS557_05460 [Acinetobacter junii]|nr:hypothetical protein CS557_05460 [Acinetobacter junii]
MILKHLHENGWKVFPEYRGQTPDGEIWIADIYAEKEQSKIVIEIQWSYQSIEETECRQKSIKLQESAQFGSCAQLQKNGMY